jgi:hypothetical protein
VFVVDVFVAGVPKSPPGFAGCPPNRPPPVLDAGCVEPKREPAAGVCAEVPNVVDIFVAPNKFGVDVPLPVVFTVAGAVPNNPPGLAAGCPNRLLLGAVFVAGCEAEVPPKSDGVVVPVGFEPNRPPPPRVFPPLSEGELAPNRPPVGAAGFSALGVAASAGLGGAPKEKPPDPDPAGVGELAADP